MAAVIRSEADPEFDWESAAPTHRRYGVLAAASGLAFITYAQRVGFATAVAEFKGPLGLDQQQVGYLMTAFLLAYGAFEMPWGWLGDRFGVRNILALIILGGSAATAALLLATAFPAGVGALAFLLTLRFVFGLFQAGTFPAISRMMADWMPVTERGGAQGVVWTASRLGGALSSVLVVQLTQLLGGWRPAMLVLALTGVAWCAAFWPWFRNRPEEMAGVNAAERARIGAGRAKKGEGRDPGHGLGAFKGLAGSGSVLALCLMYGCLGFSGTFFFTFLPDYLRTNRGLGAGPAQWLSSLPLACGVIACFGGGALSDAIIRRTGDKTWGRRVVGAAGMGLASASIVGTLWVHNVYALGLLLSLTFFGNDLAMGPAWSAAADLGGRLAGTLGGAMNMSANLSAALAAYLTGKLLHTGHVQWPFAIFAAAYAVGMLSWFRVDLSRPAAES